MYQHLPGGEILDKGFASLRKGIIDENSVLLLIGAHRLGRCGIVVPPLNIGPGLPERKLYDLLRASHGAEAYRLYNSLIRRLISLENALDAVSAR